MTEHEIREGRAGDLRAVFDLGSEPGTPRAVRAA